MILACLWTFLIAVIGVRAAEERVWPVFWGAVLLLAATLLTVLAAHVMLQA